MDHKNSYAIFLNLALYSPTIELHKSHIRKIKSENPHSRVLAIICDGKFGGCSVNPLGTSATCRFCINRARLVAVEENIHYIYLSRFEPLNIISTFSQNKHFWCGSMSSVASHTRVESTSDLNRFWRIIYKRLFRASRRTYNSLSHIIDVYKISHLFLYNGRFSCAKAAKEAARANKINFSVYDVRRSINPYVHSNTDLHNVHECFERAKRLYFLDPKHSRHQAERYFSSRGNSSLFDQSYTSNMQFGDIGNINLSKKIITIYTSSDDEYRFLGKDWGLKQKAISQYKEINQICLSIDPTKWHIVIRIHPNQTGVKTKSLSNLKTLGKYTHVTVCDPDSSVDTYHLLDISQLIMCFASSIALDAAYRNKTIVQIGPSPYSIIDIGHVVIDGNEAVKLVQLWENDLSSIPSKNNINAFVYANYLLNYKDELPSFSKVDDYYLVNGKRVPLDILGRILLIPEKLLVPLSKLENILSYAFMKKCGNYLVSILQGKFYTVK